MQFRVLGAVEVRDHGDRLKIGGVRQRRLLCSLLIARDTVVSVDRLIEQLWADDDRPTHPEAAVRTCVTRLRRALGDGASVVVTRGAGYVLELGDHSLDSASFEELVESGSSTDDPRAAEAGLRQAFSLWQGPAFEEFADLEWCQAEAERLSGLRLVGVEKLRRARLSSGATSQLVPDLERDCAEYPFHEPLRVLLVEALWRAGRSTDALRAAHWYREHLADTTGLEPSPELTELESIVLSGARPPKPGETPSQAGSPVASPTLIVIDGGGPEVRDVVAANGGRVLATAGDGVTAVFEGAAEAVACAVEMQLGLSLRIGMHTGDASAVSQCARLSQICREGQILMSGEAAMSLVDVDLGETELAFLGDFQIDGMASPMAVFGITRPDLPLEDSPFADGMYRPGNLPSGASSFVGREGELIVLAGLIGQHRVVTLVGTAGVGKTRTAVEVCVGLTESFPDGCWLVELASVPPGRTVSDPIAVGLRALVPNATSFEQVVAGLRDRRAVIVLDNCEHVIASAADAVREIVQSCPDCVVLCTSRQPLDLPGEHVFDLDPLPAGEMGGELSDAARLLVDRAGESRLPLDDGARSGEVEAVAARLGGVPLAIELAAARMRTMTLTELHQGLDQQLSLLERRGGGDGDRHSSLTAAIDWSYQLLSEVDRHLLCQLSVFAGSFTEFDAATVVDSGQGVPDGIRRLVENSLVQRSVTDDHSMFAMLDSIRQFASNHLPGDRAGLERRHAEHYLELAEAAIGSSSISASRERLDPLLVELRIALEWSRHSGERSLWTRLHRMLLEAAQQCGRHDLEQGASRSALAIADLALDSGDINVELLEIGTKAALLLGKNDQAIEYAERWLKATRTDPNGDSAIEALWTVGFVSFRRRDLDRMRQATAELDVLAPTVGSVAKRARAYAALSNLLVLDFQPDRGTQAADTAIGLARDAGDDGVLAHALHEKGLVVWATDPDQGRSLLYEAIRIAERAGDRDLACRGLYNIADASDDPVEVRHLIRRVDSAAIAAGYRSMAVDAGPWLRTQAANGQADWSSMQRHLRQTTGSYFSTESTGLRGHLALESGDVEAAARFVATLEAHRNESTREDVAYRMVALRLAAFQADLGAADILAADFPASTDLRLLKYLNLVWTLEELDWAGADHLLLAPLADNVVEVESFNCRYLHAWTEEARDPGTADAAYRSALDIAGQNSNTNHQASAHLALGRLAVQNGQPENAETHFDAVVNHLERWPGRRRDHARVLLEKTQDQRL